MGLKAFHGSQGSLYLSDSTCPYTNLSYEKVVLECLKEGELSLLLYRNDPCVVYGRFQVPWREFSLKRLNEKKLLPVRRRSGGGCVYHDLGNWNFCFLRGERDLYRDENLALIISRLGTQGIDIKMNERFDLVTFHEGIFKKISGSAFKQTKDKSYHHGTLLVDADLMGLKGVLGKEISVEVLGKGIHSHPSPVVNLSEIYPDLIYSNWLELWKTTFLLGQRDEVKGSDVLDDSELSDIFQEELSSLKSWDWIWGETPKNRIEFKGSFEGDFLELNKGIVIDANNTNFIGLKAKNLTSGELDSLICSSPYRKDEELVSFLTNLLIKAD